MRSRKGRGLVAAGMAMTVLSGAFLAPVSAYMRPAFTERISAPDFLNDDLNPSAGSPLASVSADGRYVVFQHGASDLSRADVNGSSDIFLKDRKTDSIQRVSADPSGLPATGVCTSEIDKNAESDSDRPAISADGRYISFDSCASNLIPGDTNGKRDVFVFDRQTRGIVLASKDANRAGERSVGTVNGISADGRFVAFVSSDAANGGSSRGSGEVYVYDRRLDKTETISRGSDGSAPDSTSSHPAISQDGRYVAFQSLASNLVEGDTNGQADVFVYDRKNGKTERVSVASDGAEARPITGRDDYIHVAISGTGRYVSFLSTAQDLVPNDSDVPAQIGSSDVFVHDRRTKRTERVSVGWNGAEVLHPSLPGPWKQHQGGFGMNLSNDGRYVIFESSNHGHVPGETFSYLNPPDGSDALGTAYVHDRETGAVEAVSRGTDGELHQGAPTDVTGSGNYVAFWSPAGSALIPDIAETGRYDSFLRGRGLALGAGDLDPPPATDPDPEQRICISPGICISAATSASFDDSISDTSEALSKLGGDLYGASLAYRPAYEDLFVSIEVETMPQVDHLGSPIFYGLRFKAQGRSYEVRATSVAGGSFRLFDCSGSLACTEITDLEGGYGTTGMRVVFSLPLKQIGLEDQGSLKDVKVFSALGSFATGANKMLDSVALE